MASVYRCPHCGEMGVYLVTEPAGQVARCQMADCRFWMVADQFLLFDRRRGQVRAGAVRCEPERPHTLPERIAARMRAAVDQVPPRNSPHRPTIDECFEEIAAAQALLDFYVGQLAEAIHADVHVAERLRELKTTGRPAVHVEPPEPVRFWFSGIPASMQRERKT